MALLIIHKNVWLGDYFELRAIFEAENRSYTKKMKKILFTIMYFIGISMKN